MTYSTSSSRCRPSPWGISSTSGLADCWALFSGHPCRPGLGGATHSRVPWLHRHYPASLLLQTQPPPSRLPPLSQWMPVIRRPFRHRFRDGTRRASPVARRVLVPVLSLSPRRSAAPRQSVCVVSCCLHLSVGGSASGAPHFRGQLRSLALRPGDSLTMPSMALWMGFRRSVSLAPAIVLRGF